MNWTDMIRTPERHDAHDAPAPAQTDGIVFQRTCPECHGEKRPKSEGMRPCCPKCGGAGKVCEPVSVEELAKMLLAHGPLAERLAELGAQVDEIDARHEAEDTRRLQGWL